MRSRTTGILSERQASARKPDELISSMFKVYRIRGVKLYAGLALLQGFGLSELWADLTVLTLIALILLPLGVALYRYSIDPIRVKTLVE